jgi:hypothetical protein
MAPLMHIPNSIPVQSIPLFLPYPPPTHPTSPSKSSPPFNRNPVHV